jgi:hypothetical protein
MHWIVGRVYIAQRSNLRLMDNRQGTIGNRSCARSQEGTEGSLRNYWRREVLVL